MVDGRPAPLKKSLHVEGKGAQAGLRFLVPVVSGDTKSDSLLFLHFVGGGEVIKQFAVHLHEGLQHVVDQRHDGPAGTQRDSQSESHEKIQDVERQPACFSKDRHEIIITSGWKYPTTLQLNSLYCTLIPLSHLCIFTNFFQDITQSKHLIH